MKVKLTRIATLFLAVAAILALAGCGASFTYDKDAAVKKAEEVVDTLNRRDYASVCSGMTDEMQKLLPAAELKKATDPILDESGAFKEFAKAQTSGVTQNGVDYIVVVVSAKYENNTRIYTISLTTDWKLGGLYMK